jgi:hypothetical protein
MDYFLNIKIDHYNTYLPTYLSIHLFINPSMNPFVCPSIHISEGDYSQVSECEGSESISGQCMWDLW